MKFKEIYLQKSIFFLIINIGKIESSECMKKRGFTLIELLAVIVILAIIALIATPIVMNLIENSRKGAAERSAENLEHSAEIYYYNKKLDGDFTGITFTCKNGSCSSNGETLEISGKTPEVGSVIINKDGTITLSSIVINGYTCHKENESYTCDKITKTTEKTENGMLTIDSKGAELSNYKIYGNSIDYDIFAENSPSDYQQVEYIESTGTQYIDTGIIPNQDTGFDIVFLTKNAIAFSPAGGTTGFGAILGARKSSTLDELQLTTYSLNSSYSGTLRFGTDSYNAGITPNTKMKVIFKNGTYTNNNGVTHSIDKDFTGPTTLTVFALNQNGAIQQHGSVQIYSLKIYDGDTLVRDYVPCYRVSDEEAGLYDLVEGKFYGNKGTGSFSRSDNVIGEITGTDVKSLGNKVSIDNQIKYEIPIRVTGKNLFDLNSAIITGGILEDNKVTSNSTTTHIDLYLKKGTYSFTFNKSGSVVLRKGQVSNGYFSSPESGSVTNFTFEEDEYLRITYFANGSTISNIMLVKNKYNSDTMPEYEPYKEETYSIYLDEPLRCVDNKCDYIDYISGKVVRNVGVDSDGSLVKLEEGISQDIDLPNIKLNKGINNIFVETDITPSNFEVEYYK